MHKVLPNGCEIIRGHGGIEVGLMMTELPNKPEAWLWWCEGPCLASDQGMLWGTRAQAVMRVNVWLENIGLALQGNEIVEH